LTCLTIGMGINLQRTFRTVDLHPHQVLVKELYFSRRGKLIFQEPLSETIADYQNLAASGELEEVLQPYKEFAPGYMPWQQIISSSDNHL
jgi:hypothetical protein